MELADGHKPPCKMQSSLTLVKKATGHKASSGPDFPGLCFPLKRLWEQKVPGYKVLPVIFAE